MWLRDGDLPQRPLLVAHRAGAELTGGDVLAGLRRVIALGADMIEFDVRMTGDGTLVVHHDASIAGIPLARMGYEELASAAPGLVTVEELLDAAAGRVALDVELKESGYEDRVLSLALARAPAERIVVTSFVDRALAAVKRREPAVATGLLVGRPPTGRAPWALLEDAFPFRRLAACGADFLAPSHVLLRAAALSSRTRARGVGVLVWAVDDADDVARLLEDDGVLGVVTDSLEGLAEWGLAPRAGESLQDGDSRQI